MQFDLAVTSANEVYSLMIRAITPRPIAWVATCSPSGTNNLAPFSYFNGVCSSPAALSISPVNKPDGSKKDTVVNIEATGQFTVNVVPFSLAQQMHQTSAEYAADVSEFEAVGVTPIPSLLIKPPRVQESPVHFECELMQIVPIGEGPLAANLIVGKILMMHVDDRVLNEQNKIDPSKLDCIGRMGGLEYSRTSDRFSLQPARVNG